jgi:hypothetical protein
MKAYDLTRAGGGSGDTKAILQGILNDLSELHSIDISPLWRVRLQNDRLAGGFKLCFYRLSEHGATTRAAFIQIHEDKIVFNALRYDLADPKCFDFLYHDVVKMMASDSVCSTRAKQ